MLLFLEDYSKYPTLVIDIDTPNRSWVRQARVYRAMGVKNHAFLLALVNPNLKGVDPFDPHLTMEQIAAIAYECKINPWYYFREVARVPAISGTTRPYIRANRANICLWWLFFNHVFTILIQPRQTGKSLNVDELTVYLLMVLCINTKINLLTKDDKLRRENIGRMKDIIECLPYYLNQTTRSDSNNGEEITVNRLGNAFKTHLPQMNKQRALNAGRGMTTSIFVIDEGPFQPNIKISLPAALGSMGAAIQTAKNNNEPYGVIMTTTAGKLDEESGKYIFGYLEESAVWGEHLLDAKNQEELHALIMAASRDNETLSVNATFSHRQMGETDEWLRNRIRGARAKGDDAARDFLNRWTTGREGTPFSQSVSDTITASLSEVQYREIDPKHKFVINWYAKKDVLETYMKNNDVVIGMDTSEATGKDFIGLVFLCARTGGVIGTCIMNNILTYNMIEWLADLLQRYPRTLLNPERKSTAVTIIDGLLDILPTRNIDPFKRIFNWVVQDPVMHEGLYAEVRKPLFNRDPSVYVRAKRYFGYGTSASGQQSREVLYGQTLTAATQQFAERIHDASLIGQLMGLEIKNNRIDHGNGKHDDLVVSYLLAFFVLFSGKNLHHYGIDPLQALSVPVVREVVTKAQTRLNNEQRQVRQRILDLANAVSKERDEFIVEKYESELKILNRKLVLEDNEVFSVEDLIRRAKQARRTQVVANRDHYRHAA